MGVYDKSLVEPLARVLANLGVKRGAVVHGFDGLDEITATNKTYVCEINNGTFTSYEFGSLKNMVSNTLIKLSLKVATLR